MKQLVCVLGLTAVFGSGVALADGTDAKAGLTPEQEKALAIRARLEQRAEFSERDYRAQQTLQRDGQRITVLARIPAHELAREFDLEVMYYDANTGIGVYNASAHEDIDVVLEALRNNDGVQAARFANATRPHQLL